jgi:hypothetical protein
VGIGWAQITSRILNKSNEMKYPLVKKMVIIQTLGYIAIVA